MRFILLALLAGSGCFYIDDNSGPFGSELYLCTYMWDDAQDTRVVCISDIHAALPDLHAECGYQCRLVCKPLVIPCTDGED